MEQVDDFNRSQNDFVFSLVDKTIHIKNKDNALCAEIILVSKEHLYLEMLYKCGAHSGTKVLQMVESFAKKYGYKTIELEDDSRIKSEKTPFRKKVGGRCEIWLPVFQILATGETWYNRMGYKSKFYSQEVAHNRKIIEQPFDAFITTLAKESGYTEERGPYMPSLDDLILGKSLFGKSKNRSISVREVFSKISEKLRNEEIICDEKHQKIEWLMDLMNLVQVWGEAIQTDIRKAKPYNIVYLRGGGENKITQFKEI